MAAPSFTIVANEPASLMGPAPCGYNIDADLATTGDSSPIEECLVVWWLTTRSTTLLSDIPDRWRYVTDARMQTTAATVDIAGTTVSTQVDLAGTEWGTGNQYKITGRSQMWILPEGSWTVNCAVVNPSGESTVVTRDVTVAADTRTSQTLKTSGGDHSTVASGFSWVSGGANRKLVIDNDFTETIDFEQIGADNAYVTVADPTSDTYPQISHDPTTGNNSRLLEFLHANEGMVVECLDLIGSPRAVTETAAAFRFRANRCAAVNLRVLNNPHAPDNDTDVFHSGFHFYSQSAAMTANLLLNCEAGGSIGAGGYTIAVLGTSACDLAHVYGGVFGASANESIFRTLDTPIREYLKFMYGEFNGEAFPSKSSIRITRGIHFDIVGPWCTDGDVWIGSAVGTQASVQASHGRIEGLHAIGSPAATPNLTFLEAAQDMVVVNSLFGPKGVVLGTGNQTGGVNNNENIRIYNSVSSGTIKSGGLSTTGTTSGTVIHGCIVTDGGISIRPAHFAAGAIDNNRIEGDLISDLVTVTLATWNALSAVGTDVEDTTTIDAFGVPTETVETMTTLGVNPLEMWGFVRGAIDGIGCTSPKNFEIATAVPVKVPVLNSDGNITFDGDGNVVLSGITDLRRETAFIQTAISKAGALAWSEGTSVAVKVSGDSQTGGSEDRLLGAAHKVWPRIFVCEAVVAGQGGLNWSANSDTAAEYRSAQWSDKSETLSAGLDTIEDTYTDNGITDVQTQIPAPFQFQRVDAAATRIGTVLFNNQWTGWYDDENWENATGPRLRFKYLIFEEGVNMPSAVRIRTLHTNSTPTNTNTYTSDLTLASQPTRIDIGGGKHLVGLVSAITQNYSGGAASSTWPNFLLYSSTSGNLNDAETYLFPGLCELVDAGGDRIPGFGFTQAMTASGRNPEVWLGNSEGHVTGISADRTQHGSTRAIRQAMTAFYGTPTHILFSWGHNNPTISYKGTGAEGANSAFQRDHFNLIYQEAMDEFDRVGSYPTFPVVIPWATTNMDAERREEIIGNINALNRIGIPAYPVDLYTEHAGDTSNYNGDGVHPNDAAAAQALWGPVDLTMTAAVAALPVQSSEASRGRQRVRVR